MSLKDKQKNKITDKSLLLRKNSINHQIDLGQVVTKEYAKLGDFTLEELIESGKPIDLEWIINTARSLQ